MSTLRILTEDNIPDANAVVNPLGFSLTYEGQYHVRMRRVSGSTDAMEAWNGLEAAGFDVSWLEYEELGIPAAAPDEKAKTEHQ